MMSGWIAVDLDGTLAYYTPGQFSMDKVGDPIVPMLNRVRGWIDQGIEVRIFTARAQDPASIPVVQAWTLKYLGVKLPVTNVKDMDMLELWDDRAIQVVHNEGTPVGYSTRGNI